MIVMKFGGTSVKTAPAMKQVLKIVTGYKDEGVVAVLSACGGITDRLSVLPDMAAANKSKALQDEIGSLKTFHHSLLDKLITDNKIRKGAEKKMDSIFRELRLLLSGISLLGEATPKTRDACMGYGELLSTCIFHHYAASESKSTTLLDARELIMIDKEKSGAPDEKSLSAKGLARIKAAHAKGRKVITQGFIASDAEGFMTNLGRGGSDYSASIIGAALNASEIQVWSDVDGVLTADPRIVKSARLTAGLSFTDMELMSFFGAKVLHPQAIKPAIRKGIPVRMLNTFKPSGRGTLITGSTGKNRRFKSLVARPGARIIEISSDNNIFSNKLQADLIALLDRYGYHIFSSKRIENKIRMVTDKREHFDELLLGGFPELKVYGSIGLLLLVGVEDILTLLHVIRTNRMEYHDINYMSDYSSAVIAVPEEKLNHYLTVLHDEL